MSSLTKNDIIQNSDSLSYICFLEIDKYLQNSCQSLCDQEKSSNCQSNHSSYYSTSKILLQEEGAHFQSENTILQQQFLQSSNTYVTDYEENVNSRKS